MQNQEIRMAAQKANVRLWEVAEQLEISDSTLCRKLRRELPEPEKQRILQIITDLQAGKAVL